MDSFVRNDPTPGAVFAPFDTSTSQALHDPPTFPDMILGLPQGKPGDVRVVVGHTYLVFFTIDFSDDLRPTMCTVGGQRGLFAYDGATQVVTRTAAT